jgi:hypothetical protein
MLKRRIIIIMVSVIALFSFAYIFSRSNASNINNYNGVSMTLDDSKLSDTGLTIIIRNETDEELTFGEDFYLEKKIFGSWYKVLYKPSMIFQPVGWNSVGLIVKKQSTQTFEINWEWLYGNLRRGKYRIIKKFITNYPDSYSLAVEFTIS